MLKNKKELKGRGWENDRSIFIHVLLVIHAW